MEPAPATMATMKTANIVYLKIFLAGDQMKRRFLFLTFGNAIQIFCAITLRNFVAQVNSPVSLDFIPQMQYLDPSIS